MHQQIRTSPDDTKPFREKLQRRLDKLAAKDVNVEGVAPEPNSTHILFVVSHEQTDAALDALREWEPTTAPAFTTAIGHRPGGLKKLFKELTRDRFEPNSVIVLASHAAGDDVLVSIGIDRYMTPEEWERYGGWGKPEGASAS